ncbi:transposase [Halomonas sp. DQ26W]|uniref:IS66 family insertion sequence element accessory protein TnpB n=1 Tax=Halomonas sp. DQ26W TaxID=2282311 RepID=UPI000DF7A0BB|nr:transposase [Halomonas sp. DQ26W]
MMRPPLQLWLCTQLTDMRRSYDGLAAMVRRQLGQNPLSGHGFIFIKRRRTQLKCLNFQAGGYCVWSKRLERGRLPPCRPPQARPSRSAMPSSKH